MAGPTTFCYKLRLKFEKLINLSQPTTSLDQRSDFPILIDAGTANVAILFDLSRSGWHLADLRRTRLYHLLRPRP